MTAVYVSAQQTALKVRPEAGGCNPLTGWPRACKPPSRA